MPVVYSRTTKIHDAVGRSKYIRGDTGKQEEVVLHKKHMLHGWDFHAEYEHSHEHNPGQAQNQAREVVIALPNDLASKAQNGTTAEQKEHLAQICDDLANAIIGPDHDYEYCCHWNSGRSNFHIHLIFSERKNVLEAKPKKYHKDIWLDSLTGRLAKAGAEGAVLRHRKGEVQRDSEGNIKYNTDPLSPKELRFKAHSFMAIRDRKICEVMKRYGYDFTIQDKSTPYLSQRKLYKYARDDYKKAASEYNAAVREYNAAVKEHIAIEPNQLDHYRQVRADIEAEVKAANHAERKISEQAIQAVRSMAAVVQEFIRQAVQKIRTDVGAWWSLSKDRILDAFRNQAAGSSGNESEVTHGRAEISRGTTDTPQPAGRDHSRSAKADIRPTVGTAGERLSALRSVANSRRTEGTDVRSDYASKRESTSPSASQRM